MFGKQAKKCCMPYRQLNKLESSRQASRRLRVVDGNLDSNRLTRMDHNTKKWLEKIAPTDIRFNEPMSKHTSFRIGGPAEAFVTPRNVSTLRTLIQGCRQRQIPWLIVGGGTNLLVKDAGISGLVICLAGCLNQIEQIGVNGHQVLVSAMAGVQTKTLCAYAIANGLKGMNFALGIYGTIGGATMMNAGTRHGCVADVLDSIQLLTPADEIVQFNRDQLRFGYRKLFWPQARGEQAEAPPIILASTFRFDIDDTKTLRKQARAIIKARKRTQPLGIPSAGCIFKNPVDGPSAGELIDRAGLKGKRIGGAEISTKHANFIVNRHNAAAADILELIKLVQQTLKSKNGIELEPEVKIVGT